MQETQTRLTEEFAKVCREYCEITWGKCLDAAGVPPESALRQPGSVYYDPDICDPPDTSDAPPVGPSIPDPADASHAPARTEDMGDLSKADLVPPEKA